MAATIIQFPQTHSNIFLNLTQLINLASDNQVVEEYAEIMAVCHEEGNFKPGEVTDLGWVLLHNPSQGIAFATGSLVRDMTKAQKEFLYDYYTERDCKKEANEVWKE